VGQKMTHFVFVRASSNLHQIC